MKQIEQTQTTAFDKVKYFLSGAVLLAALVAYYVLGDLALWQRVLIMIAGVGMSVGVVWGTVAGKDARQHLQNTQREVRQVVWPSREEAIRMTLIVFAAVVLVGAFLWLVDMFFLWGVQVLTGRGE